MQVSDLSFSSYAEISPLSVMSCHHVFRLKHLNQKSHQCGFGAFIYMIIYDSHHNTIDAEDHDDIVSENEDKKD